MAVRKRKLVKFELGKEANHMVCLFKTLSSPQLCSSTVRAVPVDLNPPPYLCLVSFSFLPGSLLGMGRPLGQPHIYPWTPQG